MESSPLFPANQRDNLLQSFEQQIKGTAEEQDLSQDRAFIHVALDVLGYDFDPSEVTDGKGDFGIDFVEVEENRASVFQFKSQEFSDRISSEFVAGPAYLSDLRRISDLLKNLDNPPKEANTKVRTGLKALRAAIDRYTKANTSSEPYQVDIYFVVMASALSSQAQDEFSRFQSANRVTWGDAVIALNYYPVTLDDLLAEKWRESNSDWRTSSGTKDEHIF